MFLKSEKLFYLNSFNNKDKQHHVRQKGPKINCFLNKKMYLEAQSGKTCLLDSFT